MKILFLTQWFNPEPAFKGLSFAKQLVAHEHEVVVLTGFPNYPGGRIYEGYKIKPFQREIMEGVEVIRAPLYPSHDANPLRRAVNYISFALSSSLIGIFMVGHIDVIYAYHAPATIGFPAIVLAKYKKVPFVYDINDLWPDSLFSTGMMRSGFGIKLLDWWCRFVYRRSAKVTVVTPGFKKRLVCRGVPPEKIKMIYNWSDDSEIHFGERDEKLAEILGLTGRFNIVFAGNMGKAQALDAVLSAAGIVYDSCPEVQFVFVGGGIEVDHLRCIAQEKHSNNVLFLPRMSYDQIGAVLQLADVLLVHLKDDPLFQITIPSKTQSYMAAGRPILMGVKGDAADLITNAQAGFLCVPENSRDIADKVMQFFELSADELKNFGENGRRYYEHELSMKVGVSHFSAVFNAVVEE